MLAVDTNVVVRYLTGDHPEQSSRAKSLIDETDVFVTNMVLLETEWVLRSSYGFDAPQLTDALRAFAGLPRVTLESPEAVATALNWMAVGMDFSDALHLATSEHCDSFVTFDRRLGTLAVRIGGISVRVL